MLLALAAVADGADGETTYRGSTIRTVGTYSDEVSRCSKQRQLQLSNAATRRFDAQSVENILFLQGFQLSTTLAPKLFSNLYLT